MIKSSIILARNCISQHIMNRQLLIFLGEKNFWLKKLEEIKYMVRLIDLRDLGDFNSLIIQIDYVDCGLILYIFTLFM